MGLLGSLKNFDAYPKTMDDFQVKTVSGAAISIVSGIFMLWLFVSELSDFLTTDVAEHMFVDIGREENLRIRFDIVFHNIPCNMLSLDAMDISGEHHEDLTHNVYKNRIDANGKPVGPLEKDAPNRPKIPHHEDDTDGEEKLQQGCGDCYGAMPDGHCCNTCDEVKTAYRRKGWALPRLSGFAQCRGEQEDANVMEGEGCNMFGTLNVNKVAGNFHFAPGHSIQAGNFILTEFLGGADRHYNVSHRINKLNFGPEYDGMTHPLNGVSRVRTDDYGGMFQYFVKIVPTHYEKRWGSVIKTNQFSVTDHLSKQATGIPGVFFFYDFSPIMVRFTESGKSFAHFLTNLCAIIGGVFTVAGIVDSFVYHSMKKIKGDLGKGI